MEVTLEDAYAESCRMLGEAMVREQLTNKFLSRRTANGDEPGTTAEGV